MTIDLNFKFLNELFETKYVSYSQTNSNVVFQPKTQEIKHDKTLYNLLQHNVNQNKYWSI